MCKRDAGGMLPKGKRNIYNLIQRAKRESEDKLRLHGKADNIQYKIQYRYNTVLHALQ